MLSRRGIIRNPTGADNTMDIILVVGGVERTEKKNFFFIRVIDCSILSLTATIRSFVRSGNVLHTDGYVSYPSVIRNLVHQHCL